VEEADAAVDAMVRAFHTRRDAVLRALEAFPTVQFVHPAGAFYLYLNVAGFAGAADAGSAFAERVLERENVAVVPGSAFLTPDWIRMSYATTEAIAVEGITRVARCFVEG
jgi:aspartate aminotransferase